MPANQQDPVRTVVTFLEVDLDQIVQARSTSP